jgi:hypothetical protein
MTHGIFSNVIRPLSAFWLLGQSLAADRLLGILLEPLAYVAAAFYVWSVFPNMWWRITGLITLGLYPLQIEPRHIIVFLALGILTSCMYEPRQKYLFLAGLLTGLAFIGSTFDHAMFLLGTIVTFPVVLAVQHVLDGRGTSCVEAGAPAAAVIVVRQVMVPLFIGTLIGLIPLVGYMLMTGTWAAFGSDLIARILSDTVVKRDPYPDFTLMNITWYAVPGFYMTLTAAILILSSRRQAGAWLPILPTLLFGLLSFIYATRGCCPAYVKLAVISFPFIVSVTYLVRIVSLRGEPLARHTARLNLFGGERWIMATTGLLMSSLVVHALIRDWGPKQAVPKVLFPVLGLIILTVATSRMIGLVAKQPWRENLSIACFLASVIVAAWFYNNAQPQVLSAQLTKPKLVSDIGKLINITMANEGKLTRDRPLYLQDEALAYLKVSSEKGKKVVMLATGAGVYYFLAGVSPPNRFPEVYHAMSNLSAAEVVESLDRTGAELLVACQDHGQEITGWPMNVKLARFINATYVDTGVRLGNVRLGRDCPFSVWVHR